MFSRVVLQLCWLVALYLISSPRRGCIENGEMVWYGEKILEPVSIIDGSTATCFYVQPFFFFTFVLSGIRFMYFTIFTFAYLRHTNKQDGAKEEALLIIRCISEFVNEILCTFELHTKHTSTCRRLPRYHHCLLSTTWIVVSYKHHDSILVLQRLMLTLIKSYLTPTYEPHSKAQTCLPDRPSVFVYPFICPFDWIPSPILTSPFLLLHCLKRNI